MILSIKIMQTNAVGRSSEIISDNQQKQQQHGSKNEPNGYTDKTDPSSKIIIGGAGKQQFKQLMS